MILKDNWHWQTISNRCRPIDRLNVNWTVLVFTGLVTGHSSSVVQSVYTCGIGNRKSSNEYCDPCRVKLEVLCLLCALWRLILCCSVVRRSKTGLETKSWATRLSWNLPVDYHQRLTSTPDWVWGLPRLPTTTTCKSLPTQKAQLRRYTPLRFADDW